MKEMKKILLFGLGKNIKKNMYEYSDVLKKIGYKIIAFSDNDRSKWGNTYIGVKCISPDEIINLKYDECIITPTNDEIYHEIYQQLVFKYHIPHYKIHAYYRFIELKQKAIRLYREDKLTREEKIYDCFMFNNEFDVLEMRLDMLDSLVDRFVLVEMPYTLRGGE